MKTIFGNCTLKPNGYYQITSRKEGNHNKYLHRLIFERFYGYIPKGFIVHHKDGNRTNNCILNLALMRKDKHSYLHKKGKPNSIEQNIKISKHANTSSIFRVYKKKRKDCVQGFTWVYSYWEGNTRKEISRVNLNELKSVISSLGLKWLDFDKEGVMYG